MTQTGIKISLKISCIIFKKCFTKQKNRLNKITGYTISFRFITAKEISLPHVNLAMNEMYLINCFPYFDFYFLHCYTNKSKRVEKV